MDPTNFNDNRPEYKIVESVDKESDPMKRWPYIMEMFNNILEYKPESIEGYSKMSVVQKVQAVFSNPHMIEHSLIIVSANNEPINIINDNIIENTDTSSIVFTISYFGGKDGYGCRLRFNRELKEIDIFDALQEAEKYYG